MSPPDLSSKRNLVGENANQVFLCLFTAARLNYRVSERPYKNQVLGR